MLGLGIGLAAGLSFEQTMAALLEGFGGVIKTTQVGDTVADAIAGTGIPGLILPFLIAAALTTATGSLTVSMVNSSTIVAPMLQPLGLSPELAVALIGAGGFCVLHANSSFFWLLSRLHEVPPNTLYKTFTLQSLFMGSSGLAAILILSLLNIV